MDDVCNYLIALRYSIYYICIANTFEQEDGYNLSKLIKYTKIILKTIYLSVTIKSLNKEVLI